MWFSFLVFASLVGAVYLFAFGMLVSADGFLGQALGSVVAVLAGVPIAMGLWSAEQDAAKRRLRDDRAAELGRLRAAALTEVTRIRQTAKLAASGLEEDRDEVDRIVPMWAELLGPRFYQLTANDGPLHCLRQAHQCLAAAIHIQNQIAGARERGRGDTYQDSSLEEFQSAADAQLERVETWCQAALRDLARD